jgi:hypothetical protein
VVVVWFVVTQWVDSAASLAQAAAMLAGLMVGFAGPVGLVIGWGLFGFMLLMVVAVVDDMRMQRAFREEERQSEELRQRTEAEWQRMQETKVELEAIRPPTHG